jgi:hypothetical protein
VKERALREADCTLLKQRPPSSWETKSNLIPTHTPHPSGEPTNPSESTTFVGINGTKLEPLLCGMKVEL